MAIGRLSVKVGKTGKAAPHAAYIAREGQYASRLERGELLEGTEAGNMPAWASAAPQRFWEAADAHERANGTTYREMEIALPRELDAGQRVALVREFVAQEIGERHAYQWAIHRPTASDGKDQPHVHLMFSERQVDGIERDPEQYFKRYNSKSPDKGGARKGYGPSAGQTLTAPERADELKALRGRWAELCNEHLERAGAPERIDMRSHAERGTGLVPEPKQLPSAWRGEGRTNVLEFRQARRELSQAQAEVHQAIPDMPAQIISLDEQRLRRMQPAAAAQQRPTVVSAPEVAEAAPVVVRTDPPIPANDEIRAGMAAAMQEFEAWKAIEAGKQQAAREFEVWKAEQAAERQAAQERAAQRQQADEKARQTERAPRPPGRDSGQSR